jgi:hypothetical protein
MRIIGTNISIPTPNLPGDSVTQSVTITNSLVLLALWALQKYVFKADVPAAVQGVVVLVVSGLVSYGSSFFLYYKKKLQGTLPVKSVPPAPAAPVS